MILGNQLRILIDRKCLSPRVFPHRGVLALNRLTFSANANTTHDSIRQLSTRRIGDTHFFFLGALSKQVV